MDIQKELKGKESFEEINKILKSASAQDIMKWGIKKYGKGDFLYMAEESGEFREIGFKDKNLKEAIKLFKKSYPGY
jgi:hypothetical protein